MSGGSRGFTLIELVVAVAVFAVVSAMAYSGLQAVVAGRERVAEETAALGELQTAFTLLARDLRSIVARGYRDRLGDRRPPLHIEDGRLMLVRGGYPNPMGLPRSGLRRVAYGVEDGALTRFSYTAVDSGYDPQAQATRLLEGAGALSFRFLTGDAWAQRWPPAGAAVTSTALPRAVAIRLVHPRYGELERVFLLPGTGITMRQRNYGAALITALLVTALAATAATAMLADEHLAVRRTQNTLADGQSWHYALAAEAVAIELLHRDREGNDTDGPTDRWAGTLPPVTEGGATIRVRITDLQGRLNLNALAGDESRRERTTAILERLITAADPEADAAGVTAAAVDWIDDDLQPAFPGGAEDDYYTRREPPYRSANAPMAEVSELRLVRGVTDEVMEGLSGYITALPPEASGINLNTAPPGLLERLHPGVSADDIRALTAARDEEPLTSVDEALRLAPTLAQPEIPRGWYRVDSEYFRVTAIVTLDRIEQRWQSILQRPPTGAIPVLARRPVLP